VPGESHKNEKQGSVLDQKVRELYALYEYLSAKSHSNTTSFCGYFVVAGIFSYSGISAEIFFGRNPKIESGDDCFRKFYFEPLRFVHLDINVCNRNTGYLL
jgi:hypothetical protein